MKNLFFVFITALLVLALTGSYLQRHALACELLPVMGYQKLDSEVFVAGDIAPERQQDLLQAVRAASQRIADVYGPPESKPRFFITSDPKIAAKRGANETASMHRLPWRSCIVVGPYGQNVDVISHEWLHAEIQSRVGFLRFITEIPIWFDEGAALTLDYRKPYLPENIDVSEEALRGVYSLRNSVDFFTGDVRKNYQAARLAVGPLIRNEVFYSDLERISNGAPFESVFFMPLMLTAP